MFAKQLWYTNNFIQCIFLKGNCHLYLHWEISRTISNLMGLSSQILVDTHGILQSHGSGLNELLYEVSGATHGGIEERGEAILQRWSQRCLSVWEIPHFRREKLSRQELPPLHPAPHESSKNISDPSIEQLSILFYLFWTGWHFLVCTPHFSSSRWASSWVHVPTFNEQNPQGSACCHHAVMLKLHAETPPLCLKASPVESWYPACPPCYSGFWTDIRWDLLARATTKKPITVADRGFVASPKSKRRRISLLRSIPFRTFTLLNQKTCWIHSLVMSVQPFNRGIKEEIAPGHVEAKETCCCCCGCCI